MFSGTAQFSHYICSVFCPFCVSSLRVTLVDRNKSVVWCLLPYLKITFSEKNESLNYGVKYPVWKGIYRGMHIRWMNVAPRDDAKVVSVVKRRKLCDYLSELRSSLCERRLEKTFLRTMVFSIKTAQFTQFSVRYDVTSKIALFNWECVGRSVMLCLYWNE